MTTLKIQNTSPNIQHSSTFAISKKDFLKRKRDSWNANTEMQNGDAELLLKFSPLEKSKGNS
jgi:hypothetical protein